MEYGLIGAKLGHSYSKIIHERLGEYAYELCPLPTEEEARAFLEKRDFKALNVTIPYKQLVIPYCDEVDEGARSIGAVNTLVNRGGRLYGYNTDFGGVLYMLRAHNITLEGKNVLILGTGGTHNTVAAVCRHLGAARVETVSRSAGPGRLSYEQAARQRDAQVIFNTTPAGMYPHNGECLLDLAGLESLEAVVDAVYNPFRTELLLRAEEKGVKAVCGFEMLVAQAVLAAEHFLDRSLPREQIGEIHKKLKLELCNISLIGMPSSGKSSLGRLLAARLDKPLIDLDTKLEKRAGKPIPQIFEEEGEAGFRAREAALAAEFGRENGKVLSCGGGIIKTPGNAHALRQNGPVLWVRRPLEALAVGGHRPLSSSREALARMEKEREPLYRAAADALVENGGTLEQALEQAMQRLEELL